MKKYPSIERIYDNDKVIGQHCIAFTKIDGTCISSYWSTKTGWDRFATRNRIIEKNDEQFGEVIPLFMNKYAQSLESIFKENKFKEVITFSEFHGEHSFAGFHYQEPKDITLFDVNVHKYGFLLPEDFINLFQTVDTAKVIYKGILTEEFIYDVRKSNYPVREGVIVKGGKSHHQLWMRKIKTNIYLNQLKEQFKEWQNYWE